MAAPRRLAWPALSVVSFCVSLLGCCWYGRVPLLGPVTSRLVPTAPYPCACVCPEGLNLSGADLPLDQGGASKTLETVPMAVLRERVALREQRGLSSLDHVSLSRYYLCPARKELLLPDERPGPERSCGERRFAEGGGGPVVALASFHGSGNTWVRHLLEQASGVFTGSIYCDQSLKRVFPGEQVVGGGVLAVKTHQCDSTELPLDVQKALGKKSYDKAIVLVRDPFDALISEANRRWNTRRTIDSHVGLADEAAFLSSMKWDWYVEGKAVSWGLLLHTWLGQPHMPVLLVSYEALVNSTRAQLARMLHFLEVSGYEDTIQCALQNGVGQFKRTRHLNFDPFSRENVEAINRVIAQAMPLLAQYHIKYQPRQQHR